MFDYLKKIYPEIALWAAIVLASAIFFALTLGTDLHPLANGLLIASIALLITTSVFEIVWQAVTAALDDQSVKRRQRRR